MFRCALAIVMGTLLLMQQQPVAQTLLTWGSACRRAWKGCLDLRSAVRIVES
jgi:hypothetical protein